MICISPLFNFKSQAINKLGSRTFSEGPSSHAAQSALFLCVNNDERRDCSFDVYNYTVKYAANILVFSWSQNK